MIESITRRGRSSSSALLTSSAGRQTRSQKSRLPPNGFDSLSCSSAGALNSAASPNVSTTSPNACHAGIVRPRVRRTPRPPTIRTRLALLEPEVDERRDALRPQRVHHHQPERKPRRLRDRRQPRRPATATGHASRPRHELQRHHPADHEQRQRRHQRRGPPRREDAPRSSPAPSDTDSARKKIHARQTTWNVTNQRPNTHARPGASPSRPGSRAAR